MAFLGMRGTGDFVPNQMPESWRETLLRMYPNGMAPLTAMTAKLSSEKVDSPVFHWWSKNFPHQGGAVTGVYTDTALSSAYAGGGVDGDTLFVKTAEATASHIRIGHQVLLRDASDHTTDVNAFVTAVVRNGDSSYVACKLLEDDDNSTNGNDLTDCDTILVIGNASPEGSTIPDAIAYDPTEWYNYTQIFQNSLDITRTAEQTKLRTGAAYKEAKREALELHGIEMEKAFLWGIRKLSTGPNGKPMRFTKGIITAVKENASHPTHPSLVDDFTTNATYHGKTWLQAGEVWLDNCLEQIFRYGSNERLVYAGSGALLGIQNLVKAAGQFNISEKTVSYGIKVLEWVTPFGYIYIKTHPLFSFDATTRNMMFIFEPKNLSYRYLQDTIFKTDGSWNKGGWSAVDGRKEGFLTEAGLEYHHPMTAAILTGVGQDHTA